MPTYVRTDKRDGCKGQDNTACMYIFPHDLMTLDKDGSKFGNPVERLAGAAQFLPPAPCMILSIASPRLKEPGFWRGGNSLKLCSHCPT